MHGACMQATEPVLQQADPQPEPRALAEGPKEAANHDASGMAPDMLTH